MSIYVIYKPEYKPRLVGVFNKNTMQLRRQRKYVNDKPWALRARGLSVASIHNYRTDKTLLPHRTLSLIPLSLAVYEHELQRGRLGLQAITPCTEN